MATAPTFATDTSTSSPSPNITGSSIPWDSSTILFMPSETTQRLTGSQLAAVSYQNITFQPSTTSVPSTASTTSLLPLITGEALSTTQEDQISRGIVAVIGAASAAGGALLASLVAFLFFRHWRRRAGYEHPIPERVLSDTTAISSRPPSPPEKRACDLIALHQSTQNFDIPSEFAKLYTSIRDHVHWFYESYDLSPLALQEHWSTHKTTLDDLLGSDSKLAPSLFVDSLASLRALIAQTLLHAISSSSLIHLTLLPPEILRCIEVLEETHSPSHIVTWRQQAANLLSPIYNSRPGHLDARDPRQENIGEIVALLCQILQPFVKKGLGAARVKDLERVVTQGAQFGWALFGGGCEWEFDWEGVGGERRIIVWPALVRIDRGEKVVVSKAEVVQIW